jgi:serine protease AprX
LHASSDYFGLSGTSMAAPLVSGAAALLIQKDPTLTPDQVKAKLMLTATKNFPAYSVASDPLSGATYTSQYDIFTVGAGYLDIWAALRDNRKIQGSAASPIATKDSAGIVWLADTNKANSTGQTTVWGSTSDLGNTTVWGSSVLQGAASGPFGVSTVWGSTTVWGSSFIDANTTVWGSGSNSGTTTVWGSSFSLAGEN